MSRNAELPQFLPAAYRSNQEYLTDGHAGRNVLELFCTVSTIVLHNDLIYTKIMIQY